MRGRGWACGGTAQTGRLLPVGGSSRHLQGRFQSLWPLGLFDEAGVFSDWGPRSRGRALLALPRVKRSLVSC